MPDEGMEQATDTSLGQTSNVATEQTDQAAPVATEAAAPAEGEGAAPEPRVAFQNDAELRAFLESDERGKTYLEKLRADTFNAARQNFEADLRRQAASDEVLAAAFRSVSNELGIDADDEQVQRTVQSFARPFMERNQREVNQIYFDQAKATFPAEAQAALDLVWQQSGGDVTVQNQIIGQLWNARAETAASSAVSGLSLDVIPEDHPLQKQINERIAKGVEEELRARERSANRVDPGPRAGSGMAVGASRDQEIENILRTRPASSNEYREAFKEKYGFEMAGAR
jgi:hypothetical protein